MTKMVVQQPTPTHDQTPLTADTTTELVAGSGQQPTYFQSRLASLGITADINTVLVEHDCFDSAVKMTDQLFREDARGGIEILYIGLNGLKTYQKGRKELPYRRTRLHPDYGKEGLPKYLTPKGAGVELFFPPLLLKAFDQQEVINTLFITEGEFKAMKASLHGLYCVGCQGIHNVGEKDKEGNRILNTELQALITACRIRNIVLLLDNDCLTVEYDPQKDLHKRPNSFFTAVRNFRELTKHLACDVYFQHINTELTTKGIDDLLVSMLGQEKKVVDEMLAINRPKGKFVYTHNLTIKGLDSLKSYFHITNIGEFYSAYAQVLEEKKFRYQSYYYQHNGEEIKKLISAEVTRYVRVGDEYFEHIEKPDRKGNLVPLLDKRAKSTITDDYGRGALEHINKYKAFCLVPSHHNYQQVIGHCYNAYHKLSHQVLPGPVDNSLAMVAHIFKDKYEFGLDYLQLLYTQPAQLLPVLLLQSKERNTGKSTFGQWLIEIFESNAAKLGNNDMESEFNATYAEKLLIVVDETAISKRATSESIKRMSTEQGKIFVNAKNRQQYETEWIGKFLFITNTLDTALYIGKGEVRYFVRTIPSLPGSEKDGDPDMADKLRDEIPAFLHFLANRTLHHGRKGRMYFQPEDYRTPELGGAIHENLSEAEREIRQLIEDTFDLFPHVAELQFSPGDIAGELKDNTRFKITPNDVRRTLKREFGLGDEGKLPQARYTYYSLKIASLAADVSEGEQKRNGRPYTFSRSVFRP